MTMPKAASSISAEDEAFAIQAFALMPRIATARLRYYKSGGDLAAFERFVSPLLDELQQIAVNREQLSKQRVAYYLDKAEKLKEELAA